MLYKYGGDEALVLEYQGKNLQGKRQALRLQLLS